MAPQTANARSVSLDRREVSAGATVVFPPAPDVRDAKLEATSGARVLRAVYSPASASSAAAHADRARRAA